MGFCFELGCPDLFGSVLALSPRSLEKDDDPVQITKSLLPMTILFGAFVVGTMPARSEVIIGNFDPADPPNGHLLAHVGQSFAEETWFTMGDASYDLTSAVLYLRLQAPESNQPLLQLWGQSEANPDLYEEVLAFETPGLSTLPTGDQAVTFTATGGYQLQANNSYFLRLTSSTEIGAYFQWVGGIELPSGLGVEPTGVGAEYLSGYLGNYQLNGTPSIAAVPEPASIVMIVATLPLVVGFLWRRHRVRAAA